jgi:phage terminase small subunit
LPAAKASRPLTAKQEAFALAYIETGNASEAYRRAYNAGQMSPAVINVKASEVLHNGTVAVRVTELRSRVIAAAEERTGVTVERVVQEYARIAFADMRRFASVDKDGVTLKDSEEWTDDDAAAVAELAESTSKDGGSIRFKLHSKVAALDSLAKHLGMFKESEGDQGARHLHLHGLNESELRAIASGFGS